MVVKDIFRLARGYVTPGYIASDDIQKGDFPDYKLAWDKPCEHPLVIFVGGAADGRLHYLLKYIYLPYLKSHGTGKERIHDVAYSEHEGVYMDVLMKQWSNHGQKIILVGHSWGGHRVMKLAEENSDIKIELLVTLDPVSWSKGGNHQQKPSNVKFWHNVYVDYKIANFEFSNNVARIGHAWEYCNNADKNDCINISHEGEKKVDNGKNYGHVHTKQMFDFVKYSILGIK